MERAVRLTSFLVIILRAHTLQPFQFTLRTHRGLDQLQPVDTALHTAIALPQKKAVFHVQAPLAPAIHRATQLLIDFRQIAFPSKLGLDRQRGDAAPRVLALLTLGFQFKEPFGHLQFPGFLHKLVFLLHQVGLEPPLAVHVQIILPVLLRIARLESHLTINHKESATS